MKVLPGKTTLNWSECKSYEDILFHKSDEGIARIAINRPEKRNAFRPQTVDELIDAFDICLLYTSPSPRDMRRSRMPSSA